MKKNQFHACKYTLNIFDLESTTKNEAVKVICDERSHLWWPKCHQTFITERY